MPSELVHVESLVHLVRIGEPMQIGGRELPEIATAFNVVGVNEKICAVAGMRGELQRGGLHQVVDVLSGLGYDYLLSYGHKIPTAQPLCAGDKSIPHYWMTELRTLRGKFSDRRSNVQ